MKKYKLSIFSLLLGLFTACVANQKPSSVNIVPKPRLLTTLSGTFTLNQEVNIIASRPEIITEAHYLAASIKQIVKLDLPVLNQVKSGRSIQLKLNQEIKHPEGYVIHSSKEKIEIEAKTRTGIFYGIQSLLQLLPVENIENIRLPIVEIEDEPRFSWRGMHLDVCRHFYPLDFIKKMIDMLAMHKMNMLHWHLTEDQGWRIEIKKYPLLTEVGAWRKETKVGHMADYPHQFDNTKHGGFYTQEEIKELVAYAQERHITIVPEIEMPGHAQAAIAAYPELGCFNQDVDVWTLWGVSDNVFCAGKESTFEFLENVLSEVVALFPGEFIHVGGDECPKKHWKECKLCQKRIIDEGLKDEHELQSYFIQRIERFLSSKGKKLIGWDEILEGGLAEGAAVMSWRGEEGGIEAADMGHEVVMTPGNWCYFDQSQSRNPNEPLAITGITDLEEVYFYNPLPAKLSADKHKYILGTQANLWTEYIATEDHLEYMIFPRLCALSEVQWTAPEHKNYTDFLSRMDAHYLRLSAKNINFRVPTPEGLLPIQVYAGEKALIELTSTVPSATIRYTLDGSEPGQTSAIYKTPLEISLANDVEFKMATFLSNGVKSKTVTSSLLNRSFEPVKLRNPNPGLDYRYFEGPFKSFREIEGEPLLSEYANWLVITHNTMKNQKGWIYDGYFQITEPGIYTFELNSNCGSGFYIGNELIIDNDGSSYTNVQRGLVELDAGYYPITVKYFNSIYGQFLRLFYQKPGSSEMEVFPGEQYFRE